jgi:hypothetical protein
VIRDDRAGLQQANSDLPFQGGSDSSQTVAGSGRSTMAGDGKPVRIRNLRPTFRAVPSDRPSGTDPLPPRSVNRRAAGATGVAEGTRTDLPPASPSRPDHPARRRSPVQPAGSLSPSPLRSALPQTEGPGGGRVRRRSSGGTTGWGGSSSGTRAKKGKQAAASRASVQPADSTADPKLPPAIAKLVPKDQQTPPSTPRLVPTEAERSDARRLFREIGQRFNENRRKSKTAAYAAFRHDLMDNLDTLIMGGALDLKEATAIVTNLESYTRETEAESTETPATILGRWLRMAPGEVGELERGGTEADEPAESTEPTEPEDEEEPADADQPA